MRVVAIVNQKGGCGKTTTAINLAGVLAKRSLRTLLVDMDPQGHCAAGLAIPEQRIDLHIGDAMIAGDSDGLDTTRLLWRACRNLDLAPSTMRLAGLESPRGELAQRPEPEKALRVALNRFRSSYDVCLIDCSPSIGLLTYNALTAADEVLIPVETGFFSLQGAVKQLNTIKSLGKRLGVSGGGGPPVHMLATLHDPSSVLANDLLEELRKRFGARVVPTVIRWDARLKEAASFGQPIVEYAPTSPGAEDYSALGEWLIEHRLGVELQPEATEWEPEKIAQVVSSAYRGDAARLAPSQHDSYRSSVETRMPEVCVVPGVGERVIEPKSMPPPAPMQIAPVQVPPAMAKIEPSSRAADMVARARRLHKPETAPLPTAVSTQVAVQSPPMSVQVAAMPGMTYGVRTTKDGTWFRQPASMGMKVSVAGDFNGWSGEASPLELSATGDVLETCLALKPGIFQYRLVVDGHWMPDPHNPLRVPNPFGGSNSLIAVPESRNL